MDLISLMPRVLFFCNNRSQEQNSTLIHWLMSVWKMAYSMGMKRCAAMIKEFKYSVHQAGEDIIREGYVNFNLRSYNIVFIQRLIAS